MSGLAGAGLGPLGVPVDQRGGGMPPRLSCFDDGEVSGREAGLSQVGDPGK